MQSAAASLVQRGQLPGEDVGDEQFWVPWEAAVRAVAGPASDEDALSILDVLPAREDSAYGLAWMLLHFIETSPSWPIWAALDDRSPWVVFLHAVGRSHRASCGSSSINHHRYTAT
jgi:hypothetical protein